jgi:hypothetical protein
MDDPGAAHDALAERGVMTDHRKDRLRFGFAVYHDAAQVDALLERARSAGLTG